MRAIDLTSSRDLIKFDHKKNINYDWQNRIKISSRHYSSISINIPNKLRDNFIKQSNLILGKIRKKTNDIILTPFMGNNKFGIRRRRIDFKLSRAILESAYSIVMRKQYNDKL